MLMSRAGIGGQMNHLDWAGSGIARPTHRRDTNPDTRWRPDQLMKASNATGIVAIDRDRTQLDDQSHNGTRQPFCRCLLAPASGNRTRPIKLKSKTSNHRNSQHSINFSFFFFPETNSSNSSNSSNSNNKTINKCIEPSSASE